VIHSTAQLYYGVQNKSSVAFVFFYKYFKAHKKYVSQQENFAEEFEAYKRFDIYFCRHYANTRFKMNPQQYSAKVLEFKLKFPHSSFATKPLLNSSIIRSVPQHQSAHFELYDIVPRGLLGHTVEVEVATCTSI
jgi:hypothetical protein